MRLPTRALPSGQGEPGAHGACARWRPLPTSLLPTIRS